MNNFLNKSMWALFALAMVITSCSKEDLIEQTTESHDEDIAIGTEVVVDGEDVTNTRAASAAGWTTGDGRYHRNTEVTVAAYANEGYELVRFYDKGGNPAQQNSSSYTFRVAVPQTFKAEFKTVSKYTITATAETGGTVSGEGTFKQGTNCTLTANSNSGYTFDGWYENGSKVSSSSTYTFTVSSNRTLTARFTIKENPKYYVLPLNDSSYGIFINNRREVASVENQVQLGDVITLERPQDNSCKWYVNNQYIGTGNIVSFTIDDYLYSVANNKFYISWQ